MTYLLRNIGKAAGDFFISGSGDLASAAAADAKVSELSAILQHFYHARDEEFDGGTIAQNDVKKAILFVRGKKETKSHRKVAIAGTKFGLQVATTAGGATVGSVVPGLGTALGAAGGLVAGLGFGLGVTATDRVKRLCNYAYKKARKTAGVHRHDAAICLLYMASGPGDRADGSNPALEALRVILGEEFEKVLSMQVAADTRGSSEKNTADGIIGRIADRMKSN
jgi:hypothetical protein